MDNSTPKIIFILILAGSMVFTFSMLPLTAAEEFSVITFTAADLNNMIDRGDISLTYTLSAVNNNVGLRIFDMVNHTYRDSTVTSSVSESFTLTSYTTADGDLLVFAPYSFMQLNSDRGTLNYLFRLNMPFEYAIDSHISITNFYAGTTPNLGTIQIYVKDSDSVTIATGTQTFTPGSWFWSDRPDLTAYFLFYQWLPAGQSFDDSSTGIKCYLASTSVYLNSGNLVGSELILSNTVDMDRISGTGVIYQYIAPVMFRISPITVKVPKSSETIILEYLDAIAGPPSIETEQRIQNLKDQMSGSVQALEDAATELHKDMPVIPGVESLPSEVTEGVGAATDVIINPILGINIITILLTSVFIFTALKLILYGSGVS